MGLSTPLLFRKTKALGVLELSVSPVPLIRNTPTGDSRQWINFFRNYSCYGEWASYNQMVLLSGSFGDWATPKRSTAGHFLAPHSCMPAPISERSPHQALLVRTRSPTQALHSLLPSAGLRTAKPRWSGPY